MTIIVEFETRDGCEAEFTRLISEHARLTLAEEPGCLRFDVIKPVHDDGSPVPGKLLVDELYADEEAVSMHRRNPRMPGLARLLEPLLASQRMILAHVL
ncbi:antibiotic biosynthesis monooxygenase [Nostoc sp. NIES-2111]